MSHTDADALDRLACALYRVPLHTLAGPHRAHRMVQARHYCMRRLYAAGWSMYAIGRRYRRDHSTVHYAVRKVGGR